MSRFAQVVIGPPGSGKTTYCLGMQQWMGAIGRPLKIVNLDPMAGSTPYDCFADIRDLITVEDVMDNEEYALGPNGGLVYCIEVLERNFTWLTDKLSTENCEYVIFDCPGQIELYTHHKSMKNVFDRINKKLGYQICAVQLVDAHHCSDVSKFIAVLMVCLSATIHLELPMVNVLSKFDMIERYDDLEFPVDFYTKVLDLERLLERLPQDSFTNKFKAFSEGLVEVIESYNLVSFQTLNISDKHSVHRLVMQIDKANGYVFSSLPEGRSLLDSVFRLPAQNPDIEQDIMVMEKEESHTQSPECDH